MPPTVIRRDVQRNRARLLDAARTVFAQHGLGVSLELVAEEAGMATATAYRHFPDREELVDELFAELVEHFVALAEHALTIDDPWEGLVASFLGNLEMQEANRGARDVVMSSRHGAQRLAAGRQRLVPVVQELIDRARDAGFLRPDVTVTDLAMLSTLLAFEMNYTDAVADTAWRRHADVVLDGLRARPGAAPLPGAALSDEQLDAASGRWGGPART